jgi:hypothetical protein
MPMIAGNISSAKNYWTIPPTLLTPPPPLLLAMTLFISKTNLDTQVAIFVYCCPLHQCLLCCIFQLLHWGHENMMKFMPYTGCPRRNVPNFGWVFLMLKYTDITQNTFIQSWTVTEIMAREVWNFDSCYTLIDYQIHIKTGRNMWFL